MSDISTFSLSPGTEEDDTVTEELYDRAYVNFVEEVDAVDNGIADRDGTPRSVTIVGILSK